jgi:Uncharacterized protein conserved in bacteria
MQKDCRDTALTYLASRERSAYEIKTHLLSKGFGAEEIKAELEFLQEFHYVDDARYCADYIRYAAGKGRGPIRIRMELEEKGIDGSLIRQALEEFFDPAGEREAAMKEAQKLLRRDAAGSCDAEEATGEKEPETVDEKTLAKIGRKLASLGYHTDVVYGVIGRLRRP